MIVWPALPWKSFATAESDKEYPALWSRLPLATFRAMPKFFGFFSGIRRQLAESEGLIGYSMDRTRWPKNSGPYRCGKTGTRCGGSFRGCLTAGR
jgi:hypothetical protein